MPWTPLDQFMWDFRLGVEWPSIFAAMGYGLPAAVLYSTEIWLILRNRQFNTSFYALFVARAILNLVALVNSYFYYRLPAVLSTFLLPFYQMMPNWLLILTGSFLPNYTLQADNLATALLLLNRLTAVISPFNYEKIWAKLLPVSLLIIYGIPLYFGRYFIGMSAGFYIQTGDANPIVGEFIVCECGSGNTHFVNDDYFLMFLCCLVFLGVCLALNVAIIALYKRNQSTLVNTTAQQHNNRSCNSQQQHETEKKLLVYAIFTFFGHLLFTIITLLSYLFSQGGHGVALGTMMAISPFVYDVGSICIPALLVFWASDELRAKWLKTFLPARISKRLLKSNAISTAAVPQMNVTRVIPVTTATASPRRTNTPMVAVNNFVPT